MFEVPKTNFMLREIDKSRWNRNIDTHVEEKKRNKMTELSPIFILLHLHAGMFLFRFFHAVAPARLAHEDQGVAIFLAGLHPPPQALAVSPTEFVHQSDQAITRQLNLPTRCRQQPRLS